MTGIYTMKQVCAKTHLTYETLKYYCNKGLIPYVHRDQANRRHFDEEAIPWINELSKLKQCGMSIEEMRTYMTLYYEGDATIHERQRMLHEKRKALLQSMLDLQKRLDFIDCQEQQYKDFLGEEQAQTSTHAPDTDHKET